MEHSELRNQILQDIIAKMKNSLADKMYPPENEEQLNDTKAEADPALSEPDHLAKGGVILESEPEVHAEVKEEHEPMHEVTDPDEKELLEVCFFKFSI